MSVYATNWEHILACQEAGLYASEGFRSRPLASRKSGPNSALRSTMTVQSCAPQPVTASAGVQSPVQFPSRRISSPTHGGFGRAINTPLRGPFAAEDGRIQNDRAAIGHQPKRLLYREQDAFHVNVEDRVVVLLGYLAEGSNLRSARVGEYDVEPALRALDKRSSSAGFHTTPCTPA